jgi:hypothetical protein
MTDQLVLRLTPEERLAAIAIAELARPIGMMPVTDEDAALDVGLRHLATRGWAQLSPDGAALEEPLPAILRLLVAAEEVLAVIVTSPGSTSVQSWYVTGELGAMYDHHDDGLEAIIVSRSADVERSAKEFMRAWSVTASGEPGRTCRFPADADLARAAIAGDVVADVDGHPHRPLMSASFSAYRLSDVSVSCERVDVVVLDGPTIHVVERDDDQQLLRPVSAGDLSLLDRLSA